MRINRVYSPNFGAKFINNIEIGRAKNLKESVAFVKIEPENESDITALKQAADIWIHGDFSTNIYHAACAIRDKSKYYDENSVYALTSQKSDFNKLNYDNILGLVHTSKFYTGDTFIEHLQANPEIIRSLEPEFKGIGTAIIKSLQAFCDKITCFPSREQSVKNFYYKNGFINYPEHSNVFVWNKK